MDRKSIVLVVILVLVLIFWNQIAVRLGLIQPQSQQPVPNTPPETVRVETVKQVPAPIPGAVTATDTAAPTTAIIAPVDTLIPEKPFTITTPLHSLTFSNYGGGLKKITLKKYRYQGNGEVVLADDPVKVVPDFETADGNFMANRLIFACDQSDLELAAGAAPRKISFVYDNGRGGIITKTYTINPDRYDIDFDFSIAGIENFGFERSYHLVWGVTPPPTEKNIKDDYGYFKVVAMTDKNVELADFKDGVMNEELFGQTTWTGVRTKYFTAVMVPRTRPGEGLVARGTSKAETIDGKSVTTRTLSAALEMPMPAQGTVSDSYSLYVGPIDYKTLKSYNVGLEALTSLGWVIIKPFSIAIIWLLPKIYAIIPNYGIVVLIFALLIKLIIYPLTRKQVVAMARMKDLAPKMKEMQEKYKQDPQRLNKEVMKMYKEAGANPLSGCLPLLPQLPLFFALFSVFRVTIEFRGASFAG
ncbi:MAG: membrane protein insertase YidC, partial [candidate division Zixibacteria bacterium]|nr:membrane protein insertase YidC [candidate division Zixibacteria bacterium]